MSEILSEINFPECGPILHSITAWPIAIIVFIYFLALPMNGSLMTSVDN